VQFAGFWIRVLAAIIDTIVTWVAGMIILAPVTIPYYRELFEFLEQGDFYSPAPQGNPLASLAGIALSWLYAAWLESSKWQATLGKMAVGIRVTDYHGRRISFARATGRHFAKYVSAFVCLVGYIMVAFTERKQGLHDMMAQTYVVKGAAVESAPGQPQPPMPGQ